MKKLVSSISFLLLFSTLAFGQDQLQSQEDLDGIHQLQETPPPNMLLKRQQASMSNNSVVDQLFDFEDGYGYNAWYTSTGYHGNGLYARSSGDSVTVVNATWARIQATDTTYLNSYSLKSAGITHGEATNIHFFVKVAPGGGTLQFRYKVSSESGWDYLHVDVDESRIADFSGEVDWTLSPTYNLTEGEHRIDFWYTKDPECCTSGIDAAFIDNISITNADGTSASFTKIQPEASAPYQNLEVYGSGFSTDYFNRLYFVGSGWYRYNTAVSSNKIIMQVPDGVAPGNYDIYIRTPFGFAYHEKEFSVLGPVTAGFSVDDVTAVSASGPLEVATGDINADGILDLVYASNNASQVSWYAGNGDGTFGGETIITSSLSNARAVATGDMDNDGDLDVVSGSYSSDQINLHVNNGSGGFNTAQVLSSTADGVWSMDLADLDGNGYLDIIVGENAGDVVSILLNNGDGSYSSEITLSGSADGLREVIATDVDNDNDIDIAFVSQNDSKLGWYPNNGDGTFSTQLVISTTSIAATGLATADFDKNGHKDFLVSSTSDSDVAVYWNSGGGYTKALLQDVVGSSQHVHAADINGDSYEDLLYSSNGSDQVYYMLNNGDGSFADDIALPNSIADSYTFTTADVDEDGALDIISSAYSANQLIINRNGGVVETTPAPVITDIKPNAAAPGATVTIYGASFSTTPSNNTVSFGSDNATVLTATENKLTVTVPSATAGFKDVSITNSDGTGDYAGSFSVLSRVNTMFSEENIISTLADNVQSAYAADLDGDGDQDVLSASFNDNRIAWYSNNGDGTFGSQNIITDQANGATSVFATDLNGDGTIDVLSSSQSDSKIAWYENNGDGTFGSQNIITDQATNAEMVYSADLDGDGDMDVLSASMGATNELAWYENNGDETFGSKSVISTNHNNLRGIFTADLDGDGDQDILAASENDDKVVWYENNGDKTFGSQQIISTLANGAWGIYADDIDGDGDMDVLSASVVDDEISWYPNNGDGTFGTQKIISNSANGAMGVYSIDFDGDGDQDVVSASNEDDKIAWYRNNGDDTFSSEIEISLNADVAHTIFAADFDGDGDMDVLSASAHDDKIAWYENTGAPLVRVSLPVTFDDSGVDYDLSDFGGNQSSIVTDPADGSNKVALSTKTSSAELWAGTTIGFNGFENPVPFSDGNTLMSVRVWSPTAGTPIRLKAENSADGNISVETEVNTTVSGQWETLQFDFSNHVDGTSAINFSNSYNKVSIFFNFGTTGADAGEQSYYWDDVEFITELPITSLEDARITSNGTIIKIKALITRSLGNQISLQNGTTGFHIFAETNSSLFTDIDNGNVFPGDSLIATGEVAEFNGLKELINVSEYSVTSSDNILPEAQTITLDQLGEEYESEIVRLEGLSTSATGTFANTTSYDLTQNGSTKTEAMIIGGSVQTELGGVEIPDLFTFEGVVRQTTSGHHLYPVYSSDLIEETALAIHDIHPYAAAPGTNITLYGYGFSTTASENTVNIGSKTADVVSATANKLVVTVPAISEGFADVSVSTGGLTANYSGTFTSLLPIQAVFGGQNIISSLADGAYSIISADLDNDGDEDLISGSYINDQITWYPNNGDGSFATEQLISNLADGIRTIYATDLDADGDVDILSASYSDDEIAWYPNNGDGTFATQVVISNTVDGAWAVTTSDIDNDGDQDIIAGSYISGQIVTYLNNGDGTFGNETTITSSASGVTQIVTADLSGNGYKEILSASYTDDKISFYPNNEDGTFGSQNVISTTGDGARSLAPADMDGDGDIDIVVVSYLDDKVSWYINNGSSSFGSENIISQNVIDGPEKVITADIDGDGDQDILTASYIDNTISLFRSNGDGTFENQTVITTLTDGARDLHAADLNNDGDLDVISASYADDEIAWYENTGTIDVALSTIAEARSQANGTYVKIRGIITRQATNLLKIQDDNAGFHIYRTSDFNAPLFGESIQEGDSLEIIAQTAETQFMKELVNVQSYTSLSTGNPLPSPIELSLADVSENYESVLVRISNLSTDSTGQTFHNNTSYDLYENEALNNNIDLFVSGDGLTNIAGIEIPELFAFEGVVAQASSSGTDGYRLDPMNTTDVIDITIAPPSEVTATEAASSIELVWTASASENVAGYNVYRSTTSFDATSGATKLNTSVLTDTTFSDTDIADDTYYYYRITSISSETSEESELSIPVRIGFKIKSIYAAGPTFGDVGTPVTLYGTNLSGTISDYTVVIDGTSATITNLTSNTLTFEIPDISPGSYKISLSNNGPGIPVSDLVTVLEVTPDESGYFQDPVSIENSLPGISEIIPLDLDRDSDFDLLANLYNTTSEENSVWLQNNGSNVFSAPIVIGAEGDERARDIVSGDFNGDGYMDLAVVYDRSLVWYENDVNNNFSINENSTIELFPSSSEYGEQKLLAFDVDLDGDTDLIHAHQFDDDITYYQNSSSGSFTQHQIIDTNAPLVNNLFSGDIDGDGDLDIIASLEASDVLVSYTNSGGSFGAASTITSSTNAPQAAILGDIDGDGDKDLLSISTGDDKIAWYSNSNGTGSFSSQNIISQEFSDPLSASLTDLDGDSDLDIVVGYAGGNVVWFRNQGSGTFDSPVNVLSGAGEIRSLATADMNNNGTIDILAGDFTNNELLLLNNVDAPPAAPTGVSIARGIGKVTLSWNANSESDLVGYDVIRATESTGDYTSLLSSTQTGTSYEDTDVLNGHIYYYKIVAIDESGSRIASDAVSITAISTQISGIEPLSGAPGSIITIKGVGFSNTPSQNNVEFGTTSAEIISSDSMTIRARVPSGLSRTVNVTVTSEGIEYIYPAQFLTLTENEGTYVEPVTQSGFSGEANIAIADVDGNGFADIIAPQPNLSRITFYFSDGNDPFNSITTFSYSSTVDPKVIRPIHIFGEDYPDFVFISQLSNQFRVMKNNGGSTSNAFLDQTTVSVSHSSLTDIFPADMDGDGFSDVVLASSGDNKISWYKNESLGSSVSFGSQNLVTSSANGVRSIYAADFNGDNLMDIVAANGGSDQIVLYTNQGGSGGFNSSIITTNVDGPEKVFAADLDQDGDMDILSASATDNRIQAYINNGSGTFNTITLSNSISDASQVSAADINGDGNMDVIAASGGEGSVFWFQNNGSNNFSSEKLIATGFNGTAALTAFDTDGNGRLDIAVRSSDNGNLGVIKNFLITPLQVSGLNAGTNNIIKVNDGLELQFDSDLNSLNSNFGSWISGTIELRNDDGEIFIPSTLRIDGSSLFIEDTDLYSLDTLTVALAADDFTSNSSGQVFIDINGNGVNDDEGDYLSSDFFTTMIGDFNNDYQVNLDDLTLFSDGWRSNNFDFETAPLTFTSSNSFPNAGLNPNNNFNIDDLVAFIRFWNLSQERAKSAKAQDLAAKRQNGNPQVALPELSSPHSSDRTELDQETDSDINSNSPQPNLSKSSVSASADSLQYISFRKAEEANEYVSNTNAGREITYTFELSHPDSVMALSLVIDYEEDKLSLAKLEDHDLFDIHSSNANVFLSHVDSTNGVITLNIANFGPLSSIHEREIVSLTFKSLNDQDAELLITSDLRAKGKPALQQTAFKDVKVTESLPESFQLSQNYPNPFNPSTTIHYELAEQAKVNLTVYDILGRKIETLISQNSVRPGYYKVQWDASRYASGMYIYVLNVQSQTGRSVMLTKKMLMVK